MIQPLYQTNYMGFYIKVFSDQVEFRSGKGVQSIPMSQLAGVQVAMMGIMQITIQALNGQIYPVPTMKKQEAQQAILQAHANFMNANPAVHHQQSQFPPMVPPAPMGIPKMQRSNG